MTSLTYPGGGPVYTYGFDAMGRVNSLTSSILEGNTYNVGSISYGAAGEILSLGYFGATETRTYNPMLQMIQQQVSGMMNMQYNYATGANNGRIVSSVDGIAGETVNYTYDALNRLSGATATNGSWGQGFTYDGFGNLTAKTVTAGSAPSMSVSFDPATNHQYGASYDQNGNMTAGPSVMNPVYDVENRMVQQGYGATDSYTYDPSGKRVMHSFYPSIKEFYFYGIGGQKLETVQCTDTGNGLNCNQSWNNLYFAGKLVKGKDGMVVTDRLGSVRANANGERFNYYPYGEERGTSTENREKFGTYTRDWNSVLTITQDYADQRYYGVGTGRFNVPDPSLNSNAVVLPGNWNRYAYVGGDPINKTDPSGLCSPEDNPPCHSVTGTSYSSGITSTSTLPGSAFTYMAGSIMEYDDQHGSPQSKSWTKALTKLSNANELLHNVLLDDIPAPCESDLTALGSLGIGGFQIPYTIDRTNWNDATTSTDAVYQLFTPGTDAYNYYAAHPDLTIAKQFKNSNSTKAEAAIAGSALAGNMYFSSGFVNGLSVQNTAALLMHEVLHTLGATDPQIQAALFGAGSSEVGAASDNITQKFLKDCFK